MLTNLATRNKDDEERIMHRIVVTLQIYICDDEDDHDDSVMMNFREIEYNIKMRITSCLGIKENMLFLE